MSARATVEELSKIRHLHSKNFHHPNTHQEAPIHLLLTAQLRQSTHWTYQHKQTSTIQPRTPTKVQNPSDDPTINIDFQYTHTLIMECATKYEGFAAEIENLTQQLHSSEAQRSRDKISKHINTLLSKQQQILSNSFPQWPRLDDILHRATKDKFMQKSFYDKTRLQRTTSAQLNQMTRWNKILTIKLQEADTIMKCKKA